MLVLVGNPGPAGTQVRHTLILAFMLTAAIKSLLSTQALALWPCCWRSVSNDGVYTMGYKNWEEEIIGSKSLGSGAAPSTKPD